MFYIFFLGKCTGPIGATIQRLKQQLWMEPWEKHWWKKTSSGQLVKDLPTVLPDHLVNPTVITELFLTLFSRFGSRLLQWASLLGRRQTFPDLQREARWQRPGRCCKLTKQLSRFQRSSTSPCTHFPNPGLTVCLCCIFGSPCRAQSPIQHRHLWGPHLRRHLHEQFCLQGEQVRERTRWEPGEWNEPCYRSGVAPQIQAAWWWAEARNKTNRTTSFESTLSDCSWL